MVQSSTSHLDYKQETGLLTSSAETNITPVELHWTKVIGDRWVDDCSNTSKEFTSQMEISPLCQPMAASFFSGCHWRQSTTTDLWMTTSAMSSPYNQIIKLLTYTSKKMIMLILLVQSQILSKFQSSSNPHYFDIKQTIIKQQWAIQHWNKFSVSPVS